MNRKSRPPFQRKLVLERLDERRLMASDIVPSTPPPTSSLHSSDQTETIAKLRELAVVRWRNFFWNENSIPNSNVDTAIQSLTFSDSTVAASSIASNLTAVSPTDSTNARSDRVDEGDREELSANGFVYSIRDGLLQITDVRDRAAMVVTAQAELPVGKSYLHLVGNRLIAVVDMIPIQWSQSRIIQDEDSLTLKEDPEKTRVVVFDVSDPSQLKTIQTMDVVGGVSATRLIDNRLVLVQSVHDWAPAPIRVTSTAGKRWETKDEYLARVDSSLVSNLLPDYVAYDGNGIQISAGDIGDWRDISYLNDYEIEDGYAIQSVLSIDIGSAVPAIEDSEIVVGGSGILSPYITQSHVYLTFSGAIVARSSLSLNPIWNSTNIVRVTFGNGGGQVTADTAGSVDGIVRSTRMMDEYQGDLRVFANQIAHGAMQPETVDLFVLRPNKEEQFQLIGSARNIAPESQAFAAEFMGPRAILTTTIHPYQSLPIDPIHGVDLADPSHPLVLSSIEIPGIVEYMQWIDATHVIGVGAVQLAHGNWIGWTHQVSLFDVSDLAHPITLDSWTGVDPIQYFPGINAQTFRSSVSVFAPLDIHFDSTTRTLTFPLNPGALINSVFDPMHLSNVPVYNTTPGLIVLTIDPTREHPIDEKAKLLGLDSARGVVIGSTLYVTSSDQLASYAIQDLTKELDSVLLNQRGGIDQSQTRSKSIANNPSATEPSSTIDLDPILDTDGDGQLTPFDVLKVINAINRSLEQQTQSSPSGKAIASSSLDESLDVNHDGLVSPLDVLSIINVLNDTPERNRIVSSKRNLRGA